MKWFLPRCRRERERLPPVLSIHNGKYNFPCILQTVFNNCSETEIALNSQSILPHWQILILQPSNNIRPNRYARFHHRTQAFIHQTYNKQHLDNVQFMYMIHLHSINASPMRLRSISISWIRTLLPIDNNLASTRRLHSIIIPTFRLLMYPQLWSTLAIYPFSPTNATPVPSQIIQITQRPATSGWFMSLGMGAGCFEEMSRI